MDFVIFDQNKYFRSAQRKETMLPKKNELCISLVITAVLTGACHAIEITDYSQGQILEPGFPAEFFCR